MDRRAFLAAIIVVSGCGPKETNRVPATVGDSSAGRQLSSATAPPARIPRVAMLVFGTQESSSGVTGGFIAMRFMDRLTELGYIEGKTVLLEVDYAGGDPQRLTQLAREIVDRKPDVIVGIAAAATAAARDATSTIPIVMAHAGSPVEAGLVASLASPGGNVTGTTSMIPELGGKQVEVLRQLLPNLARLGVIVNPTNTGAPVYLANVKEAARQRNISVAIGEVTRAEDFDKAFDRVREFRPDALLVMMDPLIGLNRARVLDFAARNRLPASYDVGREVVRQGGLISYGPVLTTHYAQAAEYVDKILKGAKPGDLPVQQPIQFALTVNLKTAATLGLTVPPTVLARADEVIQ
jgi:ABC-type uncharacterized transport system substrate-binding protein